MTYPGMLLAALVAAGVPASIGSGAAWAQGPPPAAVEPVPDAAAAVGAADAALPGAEAAVPGAETAVPGAEAAVPGAAPEAAVPGEPAAPSGPGPGDPLYDRLLGDGGVASSAPPTAPAIELQPFSVPAWVWIVGIACVSALFLLRSRSLKALRGADAIEVLSRSQVSKDGSLAVVEVTEVDGVRRRLLVGFGGGAPRLVADLGRPLPDLEDEPPIVTRPLPDAPTDRPRPAPTASATAPASAPTPEAPTPLDSARPPRANAAAAWARAVMDAGDGTAAPPPPEPVLEVRHDLIQEILAEREDDGDDGSGGGALPFPKVRR